MKIIPELSSIKHVLFTTHFKCLAEAFHIYVQKLKFLLRKKWFLLSKNRCGVYLMRIK